MYELPPSPNVHRLNLSIGHKFSNVIVAFSTRKHFSDHNFASCNSLNFNSIINLLGYEAVYVPSFSPGFSTEVASYFNKVTFLLNANSSAFFFATLMTVLAKQKICQYLA
jgi:hypothetical protein